MKINAGQFAALKTDAPYPRTLKIHRSKIARRKNGIIKFGVLKICAGKIAFFINTIADRFVREIFSSKILPRCLLLHTWQI